MPDLNCKELNNYLKDKERFFPVYLIYGEELLYKSAQNTLLDELVPVSKRSLNYDSFDGTDENIYEAVERVNTFSLLSGPKVVSLCDS